MNQERLAVARGDQLADVVYINGQILDIYNGVWVSQSLAVHQGIIVGLGDYQGKETIDLQGMYVVPGLIDAHVHIESSLLTPEEFSRLVLPRGTVAVVADPHEIANVYGIPGIEYILEANEHTDLDIFVMLPSCVPATSVESSGASILAEDLRPLMQHPSVLGLGEMMNYPGVVYGDEEVHKKLELAREYGKMIDGHIEPQDMKELNAYAVNGIAANHECTNLLQARMNLSAGLALMLREGTAARNLEALLPVVNAYNRSRCMFCTDDRHPDHIEEQGHIDYAVRRAIELGMDPIHAIQMGSMNAAAFFGLHEYGAIAPGKRADFIVLEQVETFQIHSVYKRGVKVAEQGMFCRQPEMMRALPQNLPIGLQCSTLEKQDLLLPVYERNVAIQLVPGEILTKKIIFKKEDVSRLKKIAVIERHHKTGQVGLGWVQGFAFTQAAIASTIAHDSHNLIVVGDNDEDMLKAISCVKDMNGGLAVVSQGAVLAKLALPVAGLLSDRPYLEVKAALASLRTAVMSVGQQEEDDPFMTLAFLALPVIPEIRITDRGLFDVKLFDYISSNAELR